MRIPIFYRKSDSRQKLITLEVSSQSKKKSFYHEIQSISFERYKCTKLIIGEKKKYKNMFCF